MNLSDYIPFENDIILSKFIDNNLISRLEYLDRLSNVRNLALSYSRDDFEVLENFNCDLDQLKKGLDQLNEKLKKELDLVDFKDKQINIIDSFRMVNPMLEDILRNNGKLEDRVSKLIDKKKGRYFFTKKDKNHNDECDQLGALIGYTNELKIQNTLLRDYLSTGFILSPIPLIYSKHGLFMPLGIMFGLIGVGFAKGAYSGRKDSKKREYVRLDSIKYLDQKLSDLGLVG